MIFLFYVHRNVSSKDRFKVCNVQCHQVEVHLPWSLFGTVVYSYTEVSQSEGIRRVKTNRK